jgi:hypothetical protein
MHGSFLGNDPRMNNFTECAVADYCTVPIPTLFLLPVLYSVRWTVQYGNNTELYLVLQRTLLKSLGRREGREDAMAPDGSVPSRQFWLRLPADAAIDCATSTRIPSVPSWEPQPNAAEHSPRRTATALDHFGMEARRYGRAVELARSSLLACLFATRGMPQSVPLHHLRTVLNNAS